MHSYDIAAWRFHLGDQPDAWSKGFDDSAWRAVRVPHDWAVELAFDQSQSSGTGYLPGGIGWYRAHVDHAALGQLAGRHVRLVFHGVYKNAQVWVNGYHVGSRASGYAAFSFDLTELMSYAADTDLVVSVRVEHTDISDSRWYNGTGITRHVTLEIEAPVRLAEHGTVLATRSADPTSAEVEVAQSLVNGTGSETLVRVRHDLLDLATGRTVTHTADVTLAAGATAPLTTRLNVPQPSLWSDTTPNLCRLTTSLEWSAGGAALGATYETTTGIRTFRFDPSTGFSINGEPRTLKGVCLHEDAGCLGTAVPVEVWLRRLLKLKAMGCNAIRMAHNPHAPELYRLCDALGFFVIDEAFDEWENAKNKWWRGHNVYPPRHQGYARDFHLWHERDLTAMVEAHINHPSIIAWSIGNEIDYPNDPYVSAMFGEMTGNNDARKTARQRTYDPRRPDARRLPTIARRLIDIVKARDTTRPVTIGAAYPELSTRTGLVQLFDLAGYNYKEHLYADDHLRLPDLPILGSENGHRYADWRAVTDNAFISGQFLWTGIDYLGEAHGWPIHGSGAGLLTVAGFEKHSFHLRRSWWSDAPVAYLVSRPHVVADEKNFWSHPIARRWDGTGDGPIEILCFANGEPRLTCGGDPVPLAFDEEGGYWTAVLAPRAASLVLETLRNGAVVARDELCPRGPAARLELALWQPPQPALDALAGAGLATEGVVQVECLLRDASGEIAADERDITVSVTGGTLLGVENGDLADNTPYSAQHRVSYEGRLIAFVRPAGPTRITFSAPGLPDATVTCG